MEEAAQSGPLVSVVIPTYERPDFLRHALATAVGQTYRNLEIIVHDNASTADIGPVVAAFADPRVRLYRNSSNIGQTANLAAGIARCRGKYLALLGDDDAWYAEMIEELVAPLERHPEAVVAFCDHYIMGPDGAVDDVASAACTRRHRRDRLAPGLHRPFARIALRHRSICTLSGAVLRRDAAEWADLPREVSTGGDLYLAYLAARTGGACYYVKRRLMHYRVHPSSFSSEIRRLTDASMHNARAAHFSWTRFLEDPGITEARAYLAMKRAYNALRIMLMLLRQGEARAALRLFVPDPRIGT